MPLFGGLRAHSKYDEGTKLLNGLAGIDDPTTRRDTLRRAIESLTAATELKPDFGPAWHNLGHAYYHSGRLLVEAANALEESRESNDARPDSRAKVFRENASATYENSLKVLDVAVKLMPDAAEVHNSRGRTLVVLHRDEEASNEFKIASEIDPSYPAARDNQNSLEVLTKAEGSFGELGALITSLGKQGHAFYDTGKYTEAISKYNEIITLSPDDPWAYYSRGNAYRRLGEYQRAISDQTKAIEIESGIPNNMRIAAPYYVRGLAHQSLGDHQRAIEDFDKAIDLDPDASAYCNRGTSYNLLGQYQRSIEDYNKAIELDPDLALAYTGRGASYQSLGNHQRAIEDYDKAIELDSNPSDGVYSNRGICYSDLGEYQRAIEDYNKAIELHPTAGPYNNRGNSYSRLGQFQQAIEDYDKAIELDPGFAVAYNGRGSSYSSLGQYKRAIEDYDKAIELDPNYANALANRQKDLSALKE